MFSRLILTQTHVNPHKLIALLGGLFVSDHKLNLDNPTGFIENIKALELSEIERFTSTNQIIIKYFEDKEDFRSERYGLYQKYDQQTLLFLGDLNQYSSQLQEGMLKLIEEPPTNCFPVLTSNDLTMVQPTILSRCRILTISERQIFSLLDEEIMESIKKIFPPPAETAKYVIQKKDNIKDALKDLNKVERHVIDLWLWQVLKYLEQIFLTHPSGVVSEAIARTIASRRLNTMLVQKKFALAQLFIPLTM